MQKLLMAAKVKKKKGKAVFLMNVLCCIPVVTEFQGGRKKEYGKEQE